MANIIDDNYVFYANKDKNKSVEALEELSKILNRRKFKSKELVEMWLKDPYKNVDSLQSLSKEMIMMNGILKEFITYKSRILTNDCFIYPTDFTRYKKKDDILKDELAIATYLDKFDPKNLIAWVTRSVLSKGEIYIYKREDKDTVLMQEFPNEICKTLSVDKYGVNRFGIDVSAITEEQIGFYPEEIQIAYKKYNNAKDKSKLKDFQGSFYKVGDGGVSFILEKWSSKGLPYYIHLFGAFMNLKDAQNIDNLNNELENYKLLHQKIMTDNDGKVLMKSQTALQYHDALKGVSPEGVAVVTSPMDIKPISLNDGKIKNYEYVNNIKNGIFDNAGISNELFNGNGKTKDAVLLSAVIDTLVPIEIQQMVQTYLNFELLGKSKNRKTWKVEFLPVSHFNRENYLKSERENIVIYGSRKRYLATLGLSPLEAINLLYAEEMLGMDSHMKPLQTAHTISGKETNKGIEEKDKDKEKKEPDTEVAPKDDLDDTETGGVENE